MNVKKRILQVIGRVRGAFVSEDLIIRLRWFLLLTGILGVYIGFQAGDDWYVKEFATYDWARGLGY